MNLLNEINVELHNLRADIEDADSITVFCFKADPEKFISYVKDLSETDTIPDIVISVKGSTIKFKEEDNFCMISATYEDGEVSNRQVAIKSELFYWEISNFADGSFTLLNEGKRVYKQKITIKDIEEATGRKLRVCGKDENPDIIVSAYVIKKGNTYTDYRTGLRGTNTKYYVIKR